MPDADLLASLYETTEDFTAWTPFLSALCAATQTDNAALIVHDLATSDVFTVYCHFDPVEIQRYHQTYAALNPWVQTTRANWPAISPPGTVNTTEEAVPLDELRRSAFYKEWGLRNNVVHGIALNAGVENGRFTYLSLSNGEESGPVKPAAAQLLAALYPHIARAIRLHTANLRNGTLLDVLDRTAGAVFVLTRTGAVVEATPSALALLRAGTVVRRDARGMLCAADPAGRRALRSIMKAGAGQYQPVALGGGYWGVATAVQHASLDPLFRQHQWMLTVLKPGASAQGLRKLGEQFGLTPAEIRLVGAVLETGSLTAAARQLGISRNTAKSQIARVFEFTGTRNQQELTKLFSSLGVVMHGDHPNG